MGISALANGAGKEANSCPICSRLSVWESALTPSPAEARSDMNGRVCCFAPGTDPEYVEEVSRRLYGDMNDPLDYTINDRWVSTAYGSAGGMGDPITLTYSFVPDGVEVPDRDPPNGYGDHDSNLYAMMNSHPNFTSEAMWKGLFAEAFNYWGDLIGITFIETVDDGATLYDPVTGFGHSPGVVGVRGDIRIAAAPMDGTYGVLAYNRYPDIGDMVMDNSEDWDATSYSFGFLINIIAHELGHAIGLGHVCPNGCTILMDPYLCSSIGGPQHDDVRGGQRLYGDRFENNNTSATATDLGFVGNETISIEDASSDDNSDEDWYAFEVGPSKQVSIQLDIVGSTYLNCAQTEQCTCSVYINTIDDANLGLYLYDTDASTVMAYATDEPAGVDETIPTTLLLDPGTYFIRVISDATNAIQMYDLDFTVAPGTASVITVDSPNGGEYWIAYSTHALNWHSANLTGNVNIELNRNYPIGDWEMLFENTPDDGTQSWPVSAPATTNARIRVTSVIEPLATDVSDESFTIIVPTLTLTHPNGGESINGYAAQSIQWSSYAVTGDIVIELNRDYPGGTWEYLDTVPNAGTNIVLGPPATSSARLRISSEDSPALSDTSDGNFTIIIIDNPPEIVHSQRGDDVPGDITFVAVVTDDHSTPVAKLFHRLYGEADYDSTEMLDTGNPNEFAASLTLTDGRYDYFIRAADGSSQTASTNQFTVDIGSCEQTVVLDDGTAEGYNWAVETEYEWAIKVDPGNYPFLLFGMQAAIARVSPDAAHSRILAKVLDSDGLGGLPGAVLWSELSGSIGNVAGGLPEGPLYWTTVWVDSGNGSPLILNAPFYLSFSNPAPG
ncbi:matrixin family metalloprotease, partial [bacterium]|nr:matrixin family metalloprotease [bacterium]